MSENVYKNKFLRITCPRCKNNKLVYNKSSTKIKCNKCNYLLVKPSGGKVKLRAKVTEVLWNLKKMIS